MPLLRLQPGVLFAANSSRAQASTNWDASALLSWIRCSSPQWVTRTEPLVDDSHATECVATFRNLQVHFRFGIKLTRDRNSPHTEPSAWASRQGIEPLKAVAAVKVRLLAAVPPGPVAQAVARMLEDGRE